MNNKRSSSFGSLGMAAVALFSPLAHAQAAQTPEEVEARLQALKQQVDTQTRQLEALKRSVAEQEASLNEVRRAVANEVLAGQRGGGPGPGAAEPVLAQGQAQAPTPVGQAPETENRPRVVAPIFEQPGVLTPRGKYVLEPSVQYAYSSSSRVALVGYTVIPAILIGLIDIREVRRNTVNATLTGRVGLTNRFELEAKVPYVYRSDTGVGREFLQGAATDSTIYNTTGQGIGDVELTARYQFNNGGLDNPYYVGSLRFKSRTGKDPFQVTTSNSVVGFRDGGVQTELPTGSGFYGLQPALTVLYPSDPAVFFGTVSYLYSFSRSNVTRMTDTGPESLGAIAPGGVLGFNFGMGLGLNDKSSFSIGYDHSSVGRIRQNGQVAADSVRLQLGTLLLGYSYRLNEKRTLNVSLGAGLTRDTPDVTLTVRMPISF
jgi:hypothetical protein